SPAVFNLPALPRTRDEVENIASLFGPGRSRVFVGKASTEDAFKAELIKRYKRIHLATHSVIGDRSPARSAVVIGLDKERHEDGLLNVSEIQDLDLDCDLVVLSACQTGKGQLLSGEGVIGLSRAFMYAGARTLVVSLWNVSDVSTSEFMQSFYRHMIAGESHAAALREAKIQMLRSRNELLRHPYYWAPFVVIGRS